MKRIIFDYPIEFLTLPQYSAHRGLEANVIRELIDGEEYDREDGDKMHEIQFSDGFVAHAYEHELKEIQ